jgi:hypothetical protein
VDSGGSYVTVTLVIIGILGMMTIIHNWLRAIVSKRRMYRMMLACGIDETTARNASQILDIDMQDVRRRCRHCPAPKTCDRWLNGEAVPGNEFCPNAARFVAAAETRPRRRTHQLARRPGRRLD